ncbi:hypothetical protein ACIA8G_35940 [Lentzea sp. NPDC051213]|uniref:hypothetical protein n=1 Tax=Lentzea sp. NPDC051213 TaxID=3364126 RepID=UPI0037BE0BC7
MNSAAIFKGVHRSWIVIAAKTIVVLQSLGIVYLLTSVWVTVAVAAVFVLVMTAIRTLSRASRQIDRIFEEELG